MAKKTFVNSTHIEGYLYEHKLERKVSGSNSKNPGTNFIAGTISIATDDAMTNIVQVHFTYVTPVTANGKQNSAYGVLSSILDEKIGSVMAHGKENAGKLRIDSAIGLNEWFDSRTDEETLVSQKRNEGGFIHQASDFGAPNTRATFNTDMVITKVTRLEENEERNLPERGVISGYIFNFRGDIMPVEYMVYAPKAIDYFEGLEASSRAPIFTRVSGEQKSQTVVRKIEEQSAWGEIVIREVPSSTREFIVNWAQAEPYAWDDESTILASEFSEKQKNREIYLADLKKRTDEYRASSMNNSQPAATTGVSLKKDSYDF